MFDCKTKGVLAVGVWFALATAVPAATPGPPGDTYVIEPELDDSLGVSLAIPAGQTLIDDANIRISNSGAAFLAREVQRLLYGWVRRDQVNANAKETVHAFLNNTLMGFKAGFKETFLGIDLEACIYLKNTNDEDQRNGTCLCNEGQPSHELPHWSADKDCSQCWIGEPGGQPDPPNGGWNDSNAQPCMRSADIGGGGAPGDGGGSAGPRLAYYPSPDNPDDPTGYYWCKGPFFDSTIDFDRFNYDPDCLKRDPTATDAEEPCPNVGTGQSCNQVCEHWDPAINDLPVTLTPDPFNQILDLQVELKNTYIDLRLAMSALGCTCCEDPSGGRALAPQDARLSGSVGLQNGYYSNWRTDGNSAPGDGGGGGGAARGECSIEAGGGGCGGTCDFPHETCVNCPEVCGECSDDLNDDPILGLGADLNNLTMDPGVRGEDINLYHCVDDDGWACGGWVCATYDFIVGWLEGTVNDLLVDEVASLLEDEITKLIEDELGLPLDFQILLTGAGDGLRTSMCSLRLPVDQSHWDPSMTCDHDSLDCPCDDFDRDGLLNYQDPLPWCNDPPCSAPPGLPRFTDDCNTGGHENVWCGRFNEENGAFYYSWMYGIGSFYPDEEGIFFEAGAAVDDAWDADGVNIALDLTMVPYRDRDTGHDESPRGDRFTGSRNNANPFQGEYPDAAEIFGGGLPLDSGLSGQQWDAYLGDLDPKGRSCYFDPLWDGGMGNLFLDSTERDNRLVLADGTEDRADAEARIVDRWFGGLNNGSFELVQYDAGVAVLKETEFGHSDRVLDVELSPGGDKLITGGRDGTAVVYELVGSDWTPIHTIVHGTASEVPAVALSPTGDYAAVGGDDGRIEIHRWNGTAFVFHTEFADGSDTGVNCAACDTTCNACRHDECGCETCFEGQDPVVCGCEECEQMTSYEVCGCHQCEDDICGTRWDYPFGCDDCGSCVAQGCNGCADCDGDGWTDSRDGCSDGWGGDSGSERCDNGSQQCVNCYTGDWGHFDGDCDDSNDENNTCRCTDDCSECGCYDPRCGDPCAGNYDWTNPEGEGGLCQYNNCQITIDGVVEGSCLSPDTCRPCEFGFRGPNEDWINRAWQNGETVCESGHCLTTGGNPGGLCETGGTCRWCAEVAQYTDGDDPPWVYDACKTCQFGCEQFVQCVETPVPGESDPDDACPNCGGTCESCTFPLGGHATGRVLDIKWHPTEEGYIVSAAADAGGWGDGLNRVLMWDPLTTERARVVQEHAAYTDGRSVNEVAWNSTGTRIAFALSDGHIDKIYGVDDDDTPLLFEDEGDRNALTWQGFSDSNFNGCGSSAAFSAQWLDETTYAAAGHCGSDYRIRINDGNLAYGTGSVSTWNTSAPGSNLVTARFLADRRVIWAQGAEVHLWNWESGGSTLRVYTHSSDIQELAASRGGKLENLYDDFDWFNAEDGQQHHFSILLSQQTLQEIFYTLYYSGLFCINLEAGESESIDEILQVANMRQFLPYLGDTDANGDFYWAQNGQLEIRFRPKDVPIVRVLGGRTHTCFPDGDLIPSSAIYDSRVDDSALEIHQPAGPGCPQPLADEEVSVYDLFVYFPHYQAEFWAPLSDDTGPPYDMHKLFAVDWDLGMALAAEYSLDSRELDFGGSEARFYEIVGDVFLGCGGDLDTNMWSGFTTDWYGSIENQCQIIDANLPYNYDAQAGISDVLYTLLNASLSLVVQSRLELAGLQADFYKIGAGIPTGGDSPTGEALDGDAGSGEVGEGTPDFLALAGRFFGALDFASLFSILGAPGERAQAFDTEIALPVSLGPGRGMAPSSVFERGVELSPRESAQAGLGSGAVDLDLRAVLGTGAPADKLGPIAFSWRLGDLGQWHPYMAGDRLRVPELPSGKYDVEVRARTQGGVVDTTPARLSFYVDHLPPQLRLYTAAGAFLDDGYHGWIGDGALRVDVQDNVSDRRAIDVLYAVDDGPWRAPVDADRIDLAGVIADDRTHVLRVRASDEFDRRVEQTFQVRLGEPAGGCRAQPGGGGGDGWPALLLVAVAGLAASRRWRRGRWRPLQRVAAAAGLAVALAMAGLAPATPAAAAEGTPFAIELTFSTGDTRTDGVPMAPGFAPPPPSPSPVTATFADGFFVYFNAERGDGSPAPGNDCDGQAIAPCLSVTDWVERTVASVAGYRGFQERLNNLIVDALDPSEPLLDETLDVPLIGAFNLGLYVRDLWGNSETGEGLDVGPRKLTDSTRIGNKFKDDDDLAIDLTGEVLAPGNYSVDIVSIGASDTANPLTDGATYEEAVEIVLSLDSLDVDIVFHQPPEPLHNESGYYAHAGGKGRLTNVEVTLRLYTVAGNLRGIGGQGAQDVGVASGYTLGLGLTYARIAGSLFLDLDAFDCWEPGQPDYQFCDLADMDADHPDKSGSQSEFEANVRLNDELISDAIRYLETHFVYEAERAAGQAERYLTAFGLTDLRDLTHTLKPDGNYEPPALPHPLVEGDDLDLEYSLFWRFNAQSDGPQRGGGVLAGSYGLEVSYGDAPGYCDVLIPAAAGPGGLPAPTTSVEKVDVARHGRDAMLGVGLHMQPLNESMDRLWRNKAFCLQLGRDTPLIGDTLAEVLNTDSFSLFAPGIDAKWAGRDMQLRLIPRYVSRKDDGRADAVFDPMQDQPRFRACNEARPCGPEAEMNPAFGPYDMVARMPHLELQFLAEDYDASGNFVPLFSVEATVHVWGGVGTYVLDAAELANWPVDDLPDACSQTPYPCRVVRGTLAVSSTVAHIYEFADDLSVEYWDPTDFRAGISSLLATLISASVQVNLEAPFNLEPAFGMTFDPVTDGSDAGAWYYGSGVEALDMVAGDGSDTPQFLGFYVKPSDVIGGYDADGDVLTSDPDGYADTLPPPLLVELLDELGLFEPIEIPGLAPGRRAPTPAATDLGHGHPVATLALPAIGRHGTSLELDWDQARRAGLGQPGTRIELDGLVPAGVAGEPRFQFRIDGGPFQWATGDHIAMPLLFDGEHLVEVWAIDRDGYMSPQPARLAFPVDQLPPSIRWRGDTGYLGRGGEVVLDVDVEDRITRRDELAVTWSMDGGPERPLAPGGEIRTAVAAGEHRLAVRAVDEAGNARTRVITFHADAAAAGCAVRPDAGGAAGTWVLVFLFVVGGWARLRRPMFGKPYGRRR